MNRLTIALAYFDNPHMLREQQSILASYPKRIRRAAKLIVVDDASEEEPAHEAAIKPDGYELEIYRILEPMPWGQLRARNLGMHVAPKGSWVLATDIDHVLRPECAEQLMRLEPEDGHYYTFARRLPDGAPTNPHPNSYLMNRRAFASRPACRDQGDARATPDRTRAASGPSRADSCSKRPGARQRSS